jgi:hypothetical protein
MKTRVIYTSLFLAGSLLSQAQIKPADTVVIRVGEASKIVVTVQHKKDLETMKQYDFQKLMTALLAKLEAKDTAANLAPASEYLNQQPPPETNITDENEDTTEEVYYPRERVTTYTGRGERRYRRRTYHSINFDLGTNNYLSNGKFPDQDNSLYTVKPWGSWYVGINSTQRTRLTGKFFVEWALGVSWYNFKFQDQQTILSKDENSVIFSSDSRDADFKKSKLTATFINASLVPMIDFGGNRRKPSFFDGYNASSFRIGAGPYVGYRIDSYSRQVFTEDGDKRKPRNHDNFYLNNLRYGLRLQVGFDDVDFFFNYDLNELFIENKGPQLNAFSFGVTF